jgi:hypothetical protein
MLFSCSQLVSRHEELLLVTIGTSLRWNSVIHGEARCVEVHVQLAAAPGPHVVEGVSVDGTEAGANAHLDGACVRCSSPTSASRNRKPHLSKVWISSRIHPRRVYRSGWPSTTRAETCPRCACGGWRAERRSRREVVRCSYAHNMKSVKSDSALRLQMEAWPGCLCVSVVQVQMQVQLTTICDYKYTLPCCSRRGESEREH